jgi:sortase (surface protein transpeptidase)
VAKKSSKQKSVIASAAKQSSNKTSLKKRILLSIVYFFVAVIASIGSFFILKYIILPEIQPAETVQTAENSQDIKDESQPDGEWIVAPEKPRYLSIAALGISQARVVELGTKGANNQLEDPQNIHDAGWYRESALPGAPFNIEYAGLYDGHNTGINQEGIFYRLGSLKLGDEILIERGDGATFTYAVREVESPLLEEIDMSKMQKSIDPLTEGLNIITCGGDWDPSRQTYTHRVTVRATLKT